MRQTHSQTNRHIDKPTGNDRHKVSQTYSRQAVRQTETQTVTEKETVKQQGWGIWGGGSDHAPLHGLLYISIIKDKQGRLAPQLHGGRHPIAGGAGIHLAPTGHAACESDLGQTRIGTARQHESNVV